MPPIQQVDRLSFGTGRIYNFAPGGLRPIRMGILNDASVSLKVDQKEIYGEGGYAAGVADGHRSIDISSSQYELNLADVANDNNAGAVGPSVTAVAFDEPGVVPAMTPFHATLAQAATYVPGTLDLIVYITVNGKPYPVSYNIVAAGMEAAGVSASVSNVGVVTFAAGDAGLAFVATYQYGNVTGQSVLVQNTYQNSSPSYSMKLWKRDRSPIDGSVGILQLEMFAVRPGGIDIPFKEGDYADYKKSYKAYADPLGNVFRLTFVNV